jgi:UDP-glucose 4-epimerase
MKTVLITGVAGFVGSNLAGGLLGRGYRVRGVDNLENGFRRNIEELRANPGFSFLEADVCDRAALEGPAAGADYIVHLAAHKIPRYGGALQTLMVNSRGTENILELARKNNCRVLFSSTSDIYGKGKVLPFSEDADILIGPTGVGRWAYAVSKIFDEHLVFAYHDEYKLPAAVVRYFGGYGPHQNLSWLGGPQSVFIECALQKKPMPIHGDGKQTRTFIYVSDMVEGTIAAMESEAATGEAFNIGSTREISIMELAALIWRLINGNSKPPIELIPYKSFHRNYEDVLRRVPDISKAGRILNFAPKVNLEEGLRRTIEWQRTISATS